MLPKSRQTVSNVALLTQYWLPNWGSLTRTEVADTPLNVTACSASEYRMRRPSQAVHVPNRGRLQRASTQTSTGWRAASSAQIVVGENPSPPYALGNPCECAIDRITG